ncbi:MAG: 2-octaprenyl-6-methoxyphenyl hydroxylase [Alphaproteobacteria bacterium]|nr:MAG: 2-octaprenyl-6-methoxyphenyl hydroxylase [Alphaproteobacteria bacterium]
MASSGAAKGRIPLPGGCGPPYCWPMATRTRPSASRQAPPIEADIGIAGAGLAGLAAALATAGRGFSVVVVAPAPTRPDLRTTALLASSVAFLDRLGVWQEMADAAAPLAAMRIVDATGRLFRAPQADFRAAEIGLAAFGHNLRNDILGQALRAAAIATGRMSFVQAAVEDAVFRPDGATLLMSDGRRLDCRLAVAADGRNSVLRRASGIGERQWSYPQTAVVLNFEHEFDHHDTSTEFHTPSGPFTVVPLGPRQSSLVWVERPREAARIAAAPPAELAREIEDRMQSMLGKVRIVSDIQAFPLAGMTARRFGRGPLVLVGEAAHLFPPIGAQGFNLGLRDVELLDRLAGACGRDGLPRLGERYHRQRALDIGLRTASVDLMNRSLLSAFLPVQMARSLALHALCAIAPLRRLAMREGIAPGSQLRHLLDGPRGPGQPSSAAK